MRYGLCPGPHQKSIVKPGFFRLTHPPPIPAFQPSYHHNQRDLQGVGEWCGLIQSWRLCPGRLVIPITTLGPYGYLYPFPRRPQQITRPSTIPPTGTPHSMSASPNFSWSVTRWTSAHHCPHQGGSILTDSSLRVTGYERKELLTPSGSVTLGLAQFPMPLAPHYGLTQASPPGRGSFAKRPCGASSLTSSAPKGMHTSRDRSES